MFRDRFQIAFRVLVKPNIMTTQSTVDVTSLFIDVQTMSIGPVFVPRAEQSKHTHTSIALLRVDVACILSRGNDVFIADFRVYLLILFTRQV